MRLPTGVKNKYLNVYIYIIFLHLPSSTVYSLFISSACAVSAMLRDVAGSCVSHVRSNGVDGEEVNGDMEIDIVLCQSELIDQENPAAMPSPASRLYASTFKFISYAYTQYVLFSVF